ncbi:MAG TPA: dihydrodipicolinate synthase family protein [Nocardioidaceae bacterium]|nr:dihydrodipicolinate synthase family protein [Nocardioidaceae bacterium]
MSAELGELRTLLQDVVAIPVTPFGSNGGIAEATFRSLVERMAHAGISVLTAGGNTGEYYALSAAERRRVVELTVQAAPGATVVAGVGLDLTTAIAEAQAARAAGAHCLMVHQPVHPFRSVQGWVDYHAAIARSVPGLALIPYVKDDRIDAAAIHALAAACPALVAVKYAVPDAVRFAALVEDTASLELVWLCGLAEYWAPFFAVGGSQGFTSGLTTIDPPRSRGLLAALRSGDHAAAREQWSQIRRFEELRAAQGSQHNVSVVKEALAQLGLCERTVRPPLSEVPASTADEVAAILHRWGIPGRAAAGKSA